MLVKFKHAKFNTRVENSKHSKIYEHVIANALLSRTSDLDLSRFFHFPVH